VEKSRFKASSYMN
jgi:hypothetical protein